jgi:hypothetical protein
MLLFNVKKWYPDRVNGTTALTQSDETGER